MWDLSSLTRDQTFISCIAGGFWTTGQPGKSLFFYFIWTLFPVAYRKMESLSNNRDGRWNYLPFSLGLISDHSILLWEGKNSSISSYQSFTNMEMLRHSHWISYALFIVLISTSTLTATPPNPCFQKTSKTTPVTSSARWSLTSLNYFFPEEGKVYPLQYSGLENPMVQSMGCKELDMTERLSHFTLKWPSRSFQCDHPLPHTYVKVWL